MFNSSEGFSFVFFVPFVFTLGAVRSSRTIGKENQLSRG